MHPNIRQKIAELKHALRKKQLEIFDSGLLPEKMRERRAAANNMTIYEMVRNETLYPLEKYLDAADLALNGIRSNLEHVYPRICRMKTKAMRWWAVVGLHLLDDKRRAGKRSPRSSP